MSEQTPLEHARAVKLRLRAASKKVTEARKAWTSCRSSALEILRHFSELDAATREDTLRTTLAMWTAEDELAAIADVWRACLDERKAMPKDERWNLAGVERWAEIADVMARQP